MRLDWRPEAINTIVRSEGRSPPASFPAAAVPAPDRFTHPDRVTLLIIRMLDVTQRIAGPHL
jgi:hypothetical protein